MPSSRAVRVESAEPARNTASAAPNARASSGTTTVGSPSCSVNTPVSSAPEAMRLRRAGKWLVSNTSRISRPMSDSLPTSATVPVFGILSANLVLRVWRRRSRMQAAPHDAADPDDDSTGDIGGGQGQQHRLRVIPDEIDQTAQRDHHQPRARTEQIDVLETVIAPGADHEEGEQGQQHQPDHGKRPIMDGRTAERVHHGGDHPGPRGNRQADEVLAVGPTGILRHRILLYVEARQPRRSAQQKQKRNEIPDLNDVLANGRVEGGVE